MKGETFFTKLGLNRSQRIADRRCAKWVRKMMWYCEMCKKQCRNEDKFNIHCLTEGHQVHMKRLYPSGTIHTYSIEFERAFLYRLEINHRGRRVDATAVYDGIVVNGNRVNLEATQWRKLAYFVDYLGRTGKCMVEETPIGLFLTYPRNSETPSISNGPPMLAEEDRQDRPPNETH